MLICAGCHICHSYLYCDISEEIEQKQVKLISWDQGGNKMLVVPNLGHCRTCHNPALEYMENCSSHQRRGTARIYIFISNQIAKCKSAKQLENVHYIPMFHLIECPDTNLCYICLSVFVTCTSDNINILADNR